MWTVYALVYTAKGAEVLVKIGCTSATNVDARIANYHGLRLPNGAFLPDDYMANLIASVTDEATVTDRFRRPASAIEQEILTLVDDLGLLCPDEWNEDGFRRPGHTEIFYANYDAWKIIRQHLKRFDLSSEAHDFLIDIFGELHGREVLFPEETDDEDPDDEDPDENEQ